MMNIVGWLIISLSRYSYIVSIVYYNIQFKHSENIKKTLITILNVVSEYVLHVVYA